MPSFKRAHKLAETLIINVFNCTATRLQTANDRAHTSKDQTNSGAPKMQ
jgi:hypothetical protein